MIRIVFPLFLFWVSWTESSEVSLNHLPVSDAVIKPALFFSKKISSQTLEAEIIDRRTDFFWSIDGLYSASLDSALVLGQNLFSTGGFVIDLRDLAEGYSYRLQSDSSNLGLGYDHALTSWRWLTPPPRIAAGGYIRSEILSRPEPKAYLMLTAFLLFTFFVKRKQDMRLLGRS